MKMSINLYGAKDYTIVNAALSFMHNGLIVISKETDLRFATNISFVPAGIAVLDLNNEVLIYSAGETTSLTKAYLKRTIKNIADTLKDKGFRDDEKLMVLPFMENLLKKSNKEMVKRLKFSFNRGYYTEWCWLYPSFKEVDLTVEDFYSAIRRIDKPDVTKQLTNPFQIERRKLTIKDFIKKIDGYDFNGKLDYYDCLHWLAKDKPTAETWTEEDPAYTGERKDKLKHDRDRVNEIGEAAKKMKDMDWVDPSILMFNRAAYNHVNTVFIPDGFLF